jgi:hypothetical protein
MLFMAIYTTKDSRTEESHKRSLKLFTEWKPPVPFKSHYSRADGRGGIAFFETDSPALVTEMITPWAPFFDFDLCPVLSIEEAVPIGLKSIAWREGRR